eukprot:2730649-Amphidinium_carterae.1
MTLVILTSPDSPPSPTHLRLYGHLPLTPVDDLYLSLTRVRRSPTFSTLPSQSVCPRVKRE